MLPENNTQINQNSDYLDDILNSTSPMTADDIFPVFYNFKNYNKTGKIKLLLEKALDQGIDSNTPNFIGKTFLEYACSNSAVEIVQFLLEKGANPNLGHSILCQLATANSSVENVDVINLLLKYGASTEFKSESGLTPIQVATKYGYTKIVKLLTQYGANTEVITPINKVFSYSKNLQGLANKTKVQILLKLMEAYKCNDFCIIKDYTFRSCIKEFVDWQLSITPENSRFFSTHLNKLGSFRESLKAKYENLNSRLAIHISSNGKKSEKDLIENDIILIDDNIQKLNNHIASYDTLKSLLISNIIKNPKYSKDYIHDKNLPDQLINEIENWKPKLVGEIVEATAEPA
ncbi:ankyrin repeat domain-containing protein [Rickettsia endosymbiont of Halotydeus destructor]|uniref:ankyrin repeat domain-containing protein n=1 Tax=Rickettsia endosymbiont of Halotydeus destructor TaxID=2996754 RepID=UPI003BAEC3AB